MKKLNTAASITAAIFGVCALIHIPYNILSRVGVIARTPAWTTAITFIGIAICLAEVVFFALMLRSKSPTKCVKWPVAMVMIVPALSALVRLGGYLAKSCGGGFAEWWGSGADAIATISTVASAWAVVWLLVLAVCFGRGSMARVMSFVAAYETLLNLVVWNVATITAMVTPTIYTLILVQYYIVWPLFYIAIGRYYRA